MKYKCIKSIELPFFDEHLCLKGKIYELKKVTRGYTLYTDLDEIPECLVFPDEMRGHFRKLSIFHKIKIL